MFRQYRFTALVVAALCAAGSAYAGAPKLTEGKGRGIVIIAVEGVKPEPGAMWTIADMNLHIAWFDKVANKPYLESEFQGLTTTDTSFDLVSTVSGHSYLIAKPYAGRSLFYKFSAQSTWQMCLNRGTMSFYVPEDRYTYLGHFDPTDTRLQIEQAVVAGKMPGTVSQHTNIAILSDGHLAGFTAPLVTPDEKARVETDMAEIYGAATEVDIGQLTPTEFDLSDYTSKEGGTYQYCFKWSSKKKRPQEFNGFKE